MGRCQRLSHIARKIPSTDTSSRWTWSIPNHYNTTRTRICHYGPRARLPNRGSKQRKLLTTLEAKHNNVFSSILLLTGTVQAYLERISMQVSKIFIATVSREHTVSFRTDQSACHVSSNPRTSIRLRG
ncbi:unnamed protein product [Trichogramma brassicae]|uniref:Uncharacterized protein n=1 Tax=Trichogramma brassicae TaxID=86971 RepID=A0A6H5J2J3_9HYME|nr:unnamed protein product [Trichogramma brassicae]